MKNAIVTVMFVFLICGQAFACTGARPIAMGGGFIALADDANATYWNPAGIIFLSEGQMEAHTGASRYIKYLENNTMVAKLSSKRGVGIFDTYNTIGGLMWVRYDMKWLTPPAFPVFPTMPTPPSAAQQLEPVKWFWIRSEERWQGVSYSQKVSKRSALGANFKIATPTRPFQSDEVENRLRLIDSFNAGRTSIFVNQGGAFGIVEDIKIFAPETRYEIDFSYKLNVSKSLSFGILLQDILYWYGNDGRAPSFRALNPRAGVAYHDGRFKLGLDWYGGQKSEPLNDLNGGMEYQFNDKVFLRAGMYMGGWGTGGVGVKINKKTSFDITRDGRSLMAGISKTF